MWCSSMIFQAGSSRPSFFSSAPFRAGTPPLQGTQVRLARSDIQAIISRGEDGSGQFSSFGGCESSRHVLGQFRAEPAAQFIGVRFLELHELYSCAAIFTYPHDLGLGFKKMLHFRKLEVYRDQLL